MGKANLVIEKRPGSSSDGTGLPNTYTGSPVTIDLADADIMLNSTASRREISFEVTGFSGFFVKTTSNPLAVRWISFTARHNDEQQVMLNWNANETNVSHHTVERSANARNFGFLAAIQARGMELINTALLIPKR